jgi:CheY-like chemotaxis protein/sugar lactone lactonase YvrE
MSNILIVDDELCVRNLLRRIFKKYDFKTIVAEDGVKALEILKTERPELIFLDLHMPDMPGIKVLEEIKKIRDDIPVIMCSGMNDVDVAIKSIKLGAYDYVSKPFDNIEIIEMAKKALAEKDIALIQEKEPEDDEISEVTAGQDVNDEPEEINEDCDSVPDGQVDDEKNNKHIRINYVFAVGSVLFLLILFSTLIKVNGHRKNRVKKYTVTYSNPTSISYDGKSLWISDWYGQTIYKHKIDNNLSIDTYRKFSELYPAAIAWAKDGLWVVDSWTDEIYCLNKDAALSVKNMYKYPGGDPTGMFFDGTFLWVCDSEKDEIYRFITEIDNFKQISRHQSPGPNPVGIFWDKKNIWTVDGDLKKIYRHNMDPQLSVESSYMLPVDEVAAIKIAGIGWDGENVWITAYKQQDILKFSLKEIIKE